MDTMLSSPRPPRRFNDAAIGIAFDSGCHAASMGLPRDSNPYGTPQWRDAWFYGFDGTLAGKQEAVR